MKKLTNSNRTILSFVAVLGSAIAFLAVAGEDCLTWDDPPCSWGGIYADCSSCEVKGVYFATANPGTHWICLPAKVGWYTCPDDAKCEFTVVKNCPLCGYYHDWGPQYGPKDQLIDGGDTCRGD